MLAVHPAETALAARINSGGVKLLTSADLRRERYGFGNMAM
jgi:hypothetical protein